MKLILLTKRACLAFTLLISAAISRADLIVDTGPGLGSDYLLGAGSIHSQLAGQFELSALTDITSIKGWITTETRVPGDLGVGGQLDISILSDSGMAPGATLYSGSTNLAGQLAYDWYGLSGLNWVLGPGTYWVVFGSLDGNPVSGSPQFGYMAVSPTSPLDLYSFNSQLVGYDWVNGASFGVQISANVPDQSATLPLFGLALAGLACLRRRR